MLPILALLLHFVKLSNNCIWPFWRDGAFTGIKFESSVLEPLSGTLVPTALSRSASLWWLYASVPSVLPSDFRLRFLESRFPPQRCVRCTRFLGRRYSAVGVAGGRRRDQVRQDTEERGGTRMAHCRNQPIPSFLRMQPHKARAMWFAC